MAPAELRAEPPAVGVEEVRKVFSTRKGRLVALEQVSFEVPRGQFTVIVGPSGCGKTTLLRILGGLEREFEGRVVLHANGSGIPFAMVFQEQSVFPWMTVRDNVAYGLALRGVPRAQRYTIAEQWIERVHLEGFADAYPHQLSGGMKQRVSIARAFAVDPEILLMDEPFSALDEQTRTLLQQEVARLCEEYRKTVVFITHSIDEAITLGDEVVVMTRRPGRIKARVPVPFPRPRDVVEIRSSPEYGRIYRHIWSLIAEEVGG
ncbi:MAG: ABC transporter ATP-binding protein [Armatimonadetes bacterium]|nr:ABC transporter ATP-binding protein [Armatimonadota bacterium]MDW8153154.1 ABC transporter ATP-binding protein [Armatimonadota bacterium]